MISWPTYLDNIFSFDFTKSLLQNSVSRSNSDSSVIYQRQNFSEQAADYTLTSVPVSLDVINKFEAFYHNILAGGTQKFLINDPLNFEPYTAQFISNYTIKNAGNVYVIDNLTIRVSNINSSITFSTSQSVSISVDFNNTIKSCLVYEGSNITDITTSKTYTKASNVNTTYAIKTIPCTALTSFTCNNNAIAVINNLEKHTSLTRLELNHNNIFYINGLSNLTSLSYLDVSYNNLSSFYLDKLAVEIASNNVASGTLIVSNQSTSGTLTNGL